MEGTMSFGKTFLTRREANDYLKDQIGKGRFSKFGSERVRLLSKTLFPRTKKRYHVGSYMDWLNWG
jgi:hypothetical protein